MWILSLQTTSKPHTHTQQIETIHWSRTEGKKRKRQSKYKDKWWCAYLFYTMNPLSRQQEPTHTFIPLCACVCVSLRVIALIVISCLLFSWWCVHLQYLSCRFSKYSRLAQNCCYSQYTNKFNNWKISKKIYIFLFSM